MIGMRNFQENLKFKIFCVEAIISLQFFFTLHDHTFNTSIVAQKAANYLALKSF